MKALYPNTIKLLSCLLLAAMLQSCVKQAGAWRNDQIPAGKRDDFHKLNTQLFNDLRSDNKNDVGFLESQEMLGTPASLRKMELVGNRVKVADYDIYDEYYIVNKHRTYDTVGNASTGVNSYKIVYNGIEHEMYIAMFTPKNKTLANQDLITVMYAKYNYGWKISSISVSSYRVNGKTAPELYLTGKKQFEKSQFAAAHLTLELAQQCNIITENLQYDHLADLEALYEKATNGAMNKYKFPVVMDDVPGEPKIFRLSNQQSDEGWFPVIYYVTKVNIADTTAVKNQNIQMRTVIDKLLPGIKEDKKYIYYSACSKLPLGTDAVAHFDMTEKLK